MIRWAPLLLVLLAQSVDAGRTGHLDEAAGFGEAYAEARSLCGSLMALADHPVIVRGLYVSLPHGRALVGDTCPSKSIRVELGDDPHALKRDREIFREWKKVRPVGVKVVYSGTLRARRVVTPCSEETCFNFILTDARLVTSERPSR